MGRNLKYKYTLIVAVLAVSVMLFWPMEEKINLGLDLRGGLDVTYRVDTERLIENVLEQSASAIRAKFREENITGYLVRVSDAKDSLILRYPEAADDTERARLRALADEIGSNLRRRPAPRGAREDEYYLDNDAINSLEVDATDKALEIIRNRADEFGVTEPVISKRGAKEIRVQIAGYGTHAQDILDTIDQAAMLTFQLVTLDADGNPLIAESVSEQTRLAGFDETRSSLVTGVMNPQTRKTPVYVLDNEVLLSGELLTDARMGIDEMGRPIVLIRFDRQGAQTFANVTSEHVDRLLAIVLDDRVQSAPRIEEPIYGGRAQITGNFTDQEANQLAVVLRCGALPAPLVRESSNVVSATLGRDSIMRGVVSIAFGGVTVLLYMLIYYKFAGLVANLALIMNLIILMGILAFLRATLTLAGIAGILLTIGMAVDANVIIFERIKEELREGKTVRSSIDAGFSKAWSTILDANVTTLITAVVLYFFGTGPIRGFAVTLAIGIIASLYTALFVVRVVLETVTTMRKTKTLSI